MMGLGGLPTMTPPAGVGGADAGQSALLQLMMQGGASPADEVEIDLPTLLAMIQGGGGQMAGLLPPPGPPLPSPPPASSSYQTPGGGGGSPLDLISAMGGGDPNAGLPMPAVPPAMAGIVQGGPGMDDLSVPSPVMPPPQGGQPGAMGPPPDMMGGSESGSPAGGSLGDRMMGKLSRQGPPPGKGGRGKK